MPMLTVGMNLKSKEEMLLSVFEELLPRKEKKMKSNDKKEMFLWLGDKYNWAIQWGINVNISVIKRHTHEENQQGTKFIAHIGEILER